GVESLEEQQTRSLRRKDQPALQPQARQHQEIPQITEIQEVLCSVLPPIKRDPYGHANSPCDLEPERHAHGRHCTHRRHGQPRASRSEPSFSKFSTSVTCWR